MTSRCRLASRHAAIMPRELAHQVRRVQDELAAGDLMQSPLRVLIELLDDAELEAAARIWGLRTLPGVANRRDLSSRLLRVINDPGRVEQVTQSRGRMPRRSGKP